MNAWDKWKFLLNMSHWALFLKRSPAASQDFLSQQCLPTLVVWTALKDLSQPLKIQFPATLVSVWDRLLCSEQIKAFPQSFLLLSATAPRNPHHPPGHLPQAASSTPPSPSPLSPVVAKSSPFHVLIISHLDYRDGLLICPLPLFHLPYFVGRFDQIPALLESQQQWLNPLAPE